MTESVLHITNGDSTTLLLKKMKFKGTFITWREMLCEGHTETSVGSENFWKSRFDFLKTYYHITKKQFIDLTLKEYRNLCNQKKQEEIVLWFEYDLFCQINMIAVISWIKRYRKGRKISLICSGKITNSKKLHGLSELSEHQLTNHYKNRIALTQDDIEYADYIWQLYCSDNPLQLENSYKYQQNNTFQYLTEALFAHLQRFPSIGNGLNSIENNILTIAANNQFDNKNNLVGKLLKNQENYGFGDLQYLKKITDLKGLFKSFEPVVLNNTGIKVQQKLLNMYASVRNDSSFLGGAKKYNFLFDEDSKKLLQITTL